MIYYQEPASADNSMYLVFYLIVVTKLNGSLDPFLAKHNKWYIHVYMSNLVFPQDLWWFFALVLNSSIYVIK